MPLSMPRLLLALLAGAALSAQAQQGPSDPQIAQIVVTANQVDVDAGKLASSRTRSKEVKQFAQQMVTDHTKANQKLGDIARKLDISVPDEAALTDKVKKMILEWRDESFDKSYVNNQVDAHEKAVELFKKEAASSDKAELKAFASETLPTLEHHLEQAKALQSKHGK